jgi:hypothetical protein
VKRGRRYEAVYRDWRSGADTAALAAEYGLSERRIREVIDDLRAGSVEALDLNSRRTPFRFAEDLLLRRLTAVSEAAELARHARRVGNLSVALGAMRRRDEALSMLTQLMQECGFLPRHLRALRTDADVIAMAEAALGVFERHEVPEKVQEAFVQALDLKTGLVDGHLELDLVVPPLGVRLEVDD